MTWRDISVLTGSATPEWPGDTPFSCGWTTQLSEGATVNLSSITTSPHVGTHADSPLHVRAGASASESLPVKAFVGIAVVVSVAGDPRDVLASEIQSRIPSGVVRLLLRTGCSIADGAFPPDWPALDVSAARALTTSGMRLIGVDAPSVDRRHSKDLAIHHAVFDAGGVILENLDLRGVEDGTYELLALPMRWSGLDAAPVRAVLRSPSPAATAR